MAVAAQPVRFTVTLPSRRMVAALVASLAVHAGLAWGLYSFALGHTTASPRSLPQMSGVASDLALAMQGLSAPALVARPNVPEESPPAAAPAPVPAHEPGPMPVASVPEVGPMKPPHTEIEVTPGIDRSDAQTPNWLGAAQGTEHHAMKSTTDQPAMSRDPGRRGNDDVHEGPAAQPTETDRGVGGKGSGSGSGEGDDSGPAKTSESQGQDSPREESVARQGHDGSPGGEEDGASSNGAHVQEAADGAAERVGLHDAPIAPKPQDITGLMPEQAPVDVTVPKPLVEATKQEKPASLAIDEQEAHESSVLGAPLGAGGGQAPAVQPGSESKVPGKKSDAESPASSREISTKFRPGTPIAHEGIRIRPKLPRYTMTTRAMSRPSNPLVIIKFNRAGKVVKAEFAPGKTTGSPDWDGPLLASLYEWTATGKKLQELPTDDPNAVLVLKLDYILAE